LGCKIYPWFFKDKVQYCPGEVCDVKSRQEIQKVSITQILMVLGFIALTILLVYLFNDILSEKPFDLFGIENTKLPE